MRSAFEEDISEQIRLIFKGGRKDYDISLFHDNVPFTNWKHFNSKEPTPSDNLKTIPGLEEHFFNKLNLTKEVILPYVDRRIYPILKIASFLTYAPENNKITNLNGQNSIQPVGIRGEGLFRLLKSMNEEQLNEIKTQLQFIDWFQDFTLPGEGSLSESKIQIKDRYIHKYKELLDQRSTNEGFLFLLFYVSLLVSEYTPSFFAIDNVDNALNPSLCTRITKIITELAKKYNKQVILTTHNPAILDGLNLNDPAQKLYVISRNQNGETRARLVPKSKTPNGKTVKLSEAFLRGYLGGLNKNVY